ncbi:hypothetical protein V6N13_085523 [Hibiscus sabdariffa]
MAFIGDAALSKLLDLLLGKSIDSALNFVTDHKQVYEQLKEWKSILPDIKAVLNHAEEKQIRDEGVKRWLEDLQDLAYDVDDILDEFAYEELRLKLHKTQAQAGTSKVRKLLPTCCTGGDFTPSSFLFKNSMIPKLKEITARLNGLSTRRSSLGLSEILSQAASYERKKPVRLQPTSVVDGSVEYVGRHNEKREMLDLLKTNNSEGVCVLSIIGMGGMDDLWNESSHDWTILQSPFGAMTKIIVTTGLQNVSTTVDPMKVFHLDKLSHDDCLSIFTQCALRARNFDGHLQFKQVGENIVKRCNGLPLAAKAIGSFLRTIKNLDEWERINESEMWDLPENQCGIIPALRLSYYHLPSHLKRCFAYCSIFPKDYEFNEEEIVLLWSAEGFLQQNGKHQIKDLGNRYFQDLVSRSFFQISSKEKSRFVMHDLMNDLAQLVAGDICCRLEDNKQQMFSHRSRHSSYIAYPHGTVKTFEAFDKANSLRTFLRLNQDYWWSYLTNVVLVELLPRLSSLRVLSLRGYEITELPEFLENLKHLRYLNLSHTRICCLPDSLCTLYHLETLLLEECSKLQKLPSKMEDLVNLHFLDIRGAHSIKTMPLGIGNLTNLQRLSNFVISDDDGHRIRELKTLSNLRSDLYLSGLENVNVQDAREARLNEKSGINKLVLQWSSDFEKPTRKNEVEEQVLDSLHPSKKLEQLVIENFGGAKFSTWIADSSFRNLSTLKLLDCKNCKSLPPIGMLPLLKSFLVRGLDEVHKIGIEFFGEDQSNAFASLETLSFESLPNWKEWEACEGDKQVSRFPSLLKLLIIQCPQLLGRLPTRLQSLQRLEIYECRRLVVSISSFPSLCELSVVGCEELVDECSSAPVEEVASLQSVSFVHFKV